MSKQRDPKTGKFVRTKPDYKAMYNEEKMTCENLRAELQLECEERDKLQIKVADYGMRLKFLLNHCGPICKWMFKRKFVKE